MDKLQDKSMLDVLKMQKSDANNQFFKFVEKNYINWLNGKSQNAPTMSHTLFKNKFLNLLEILPNFIFFSFNFKEKCTKKRQIKENTH